MNTDTVNDVTSGTPLLYLWQKAHPEAGDLCTLKLKVEGLKEDVGFNPTYIYNGCTLGWFLIVVVSIVPSFNFSLKYVLFGDVLAGTFIFFLALLFAAHLRMEKKILQKQIDNGEATLGHYLQVISELGLEAYCGHLTVAGYVSSYDYVTVDILKSHLVKLATRLVKAEEEFDCATANPQVNRFDKARAGERWMEENFKFQKTFHLLTTDFRLDLNKAEIFEGVKVKR